jgi:hypothetical protein
MDEVDAIFAQPRVFNVQKGVNGFQSMVEQLELLLPVNAKVMEHMNFVVKEAFMQLLTWADRGLLVICTASWLHSKPLSMYMLAACNACTNDYKCESESDADSDVSDSDEERHVKLWYFKDEHQFLKDKYTQRVYDVETKFELGIYVGGEDDLIDFYEDGPQSSGSESE